MYNKKIVLLSTFLCLMTVSACKVNQAETAKSSINQNVNTKLPNKQKKELENEKSKIPNLQAGLLTGIDATTDSVIGEFDFKNFTYPLPRGWQDTDSKEVILENGKRRMTQNKIGMAYVTTKFFDVTGDKEDEAIVILKVGTGGGAIPQIVYIYEWQNDLPELLWYFRTGDRAAGGLKRVYAEDGELVVELFGRDRYIFGQMETSKIVGDEQQLCCPTHWTKTHYKKEGSGFKLERDRWTYSFKHKDAPPIKNMNETRLEEERGS